MSDTFINKIYTEDDTRTYFNFRGYEIPVHLMKLTGGGGETFEYIAIEHMKILSELVGLNSNLDVLEIGCGIGRDAIPLTEILSSRGSYLGIDIYNDSIRWCNSNISSKNPQFKFCLFDIKDDWFNPNGTKTLQECTIPCDKNTIDLVILQSVFTHLVEQDVRFYLHQFSKILRSDGKVYATFFIIDDSLLSNQTKNSYITFNHQISPGVWIHSTVDPAIAVGYTIETLEKLANEAGLRIETTAFGCWSGRNGNIIGGQDSVIFCLKR